MGTLPSGGALAGLFWGEERKAGPREGCFRLLTVSKWAMGSLAGLLPFRQTRMHTPVPSLTSGTLGQLSGNLLYPHGSPVTRAEPPGDACRRWNSPGISPSGEGLPLAGGGKVCLLTQCKLELQARPT